MSHDSALALLTGSVPAVSTPPTATEPQVDKRVESTPSQPQDISSKAAAYFAKKESELQRQRQEMKAEKAKLEEANKQYTEYLRQKKEDPIAALKTLGFSESDIFNYMAAQQPVERTPEEKAAEAASAAAEARIKAFEDAQTKKQLEMQQKADQELIQSYVSDIGKTVQSNPEQYEYCNYYGKAAHDLIYETALAIVKESNGEEVPTPTEVVKMVEEYYEAQDQAMMTLKKRQPKSTPPPVESKEAVRTRTLVEKPKAQGEAAKPPRTLSRNATATAASARSTVGETREQKRERLMQRLRDGT